MSYIALREPSRDVISGAGVLLFIVTIAFYVPTLGILSAFVLPLPIIYYHSKLGRQLTSGMVVLSMSVLVAMLGLMSGDMFFFLELFILGFILAEMINAKTSIDEVVLYTTCVVALTSVASIVYYSQATGTSALELTTKYVENHLRMSLSLYQDMGVKEDNINALSQSMESILYILVRIVPSLVIAFVMLVVWCNILLARWFFQMKNISFPNFGNLSRWKTSELLVWVVIGAGFCSLLPVMPIKILGLNMLIILMMLYFFQGMAIIAFWFDRYQVSKSMRSLFYVFLCLQQIIFFMIVGLGFFDIWGNYRKLAQKFETDNDFDHNL